MAAQNAVNRDINKGSAGRECANTRVGRSEEHTSELQSLAYLVCRLLLEKKKKNKTQTSQTPRSNTSHYANPLAASSYVITPAYQIPTHLKHADTHRHRPRLVT